MEGLCLILVSDAGLGQQDLLVCIGRLCCHCRLSFLLPWFWPLPLWGAVERPMGKNFFCWGTDAVLEAF